MFQGIYIDKQDDQQTVQLADLDEAELPAGEVTVAVEYSTINYKDALAITGKAPIVRRFPMVAGIDFAGTVLDSSDERFETGQQVLANGWGLGEDHWGGLAEKVRVPADWLVPLPEPLTTQEAMALGTAGFTAMLSVRTLERQGVHPDQGPVVVSGATGGVGSVAVFLLAQRGFEVIASTGRSQETSYLRNLGASEIIDRKTLSEPGQPLGRQRFAGAVDVAGGHTLANICAQTHFHGVVAACGLAESMEFPATVAPFILRGIHLVGINSVYCPQEERLQAWQDLADAWDPEVFVDVMQTAELDEVIEKSQALLQGDIRGRIVVNVGG